MHHIDYVEDVEDAQCDVPQDHFKASVLAACTLALTEQILQHGGEKKKKKQIG